MLSEDIKFLPQASYDRNPIIASVVKKNIFYTMPSCHSLRLVDGELLGDPLDLKMFEFTGWSFEEGAASKYHKFGDGEGQQHHFSPSIAPPPAGMESNINDMQQTQNPVPVELNVLKSFEFVSH